MAATTSDTFFPTPSSGTLVFPRNKYMVLKLGQKEVLCEDVFESMVSSGWGAGLCFATPTGAVSSQPVRLAIAIASHDTAPHLTCRPPRRAVLSVFPSAAA
jgi:hypothetical protein